MACTQILLLAFNSAYAADIGYGDDSRLSVIEENDAFAIPPTDRWYTQGLEVHYLSTTLSAGGAPRLPGAYFDPSSSSATRFELFGGQQIFTPINLRFYPPEPTDRPYAGWLYAGFGLLQKTADQSLDQLQLQLGVVGPASLAANAQDGFHGLLGQVTPRAWSYQLKNEPGIVVAYEHKWRIQLPLGSSLGFDAIPELGASVGNIYSYGEASALIRCGNNLNADYGPIRMQPALSGTAWFDPDELQGSKSDPWWVILPPASRCCGRKLSSSMRNSCGGAKNSSTSRQSIGTPAST